MGLQWWCAARSTPWTWTWRPYVGVWILVALAAAGYVTASRRLGEPPSRGRASWFAGGLLCLWVGLDWPLAALGASYLASAHALQFLLVGVAAPAALLLGTPRRAFGWLSRRPRLGPALSTVTRPLWAFAIFNGGMIVTHWPGVTDALMTGAGGSFLLDMTWIACGLVFWWPLIAPWPERPDFHPLLRIAYLAINALLIRPPFLMMVFAEYPIYGIYELAPPFPGTTPVDDQQLAGALMKLGTAWLMGLGVFVEFVRWVRREKASEREEARRRSEAPTARPPGPARPGPPTSR